MDQIIYPEPLKNFVNGCLKLLFFQARTLRLIILPEAASDGVARASKRRLYLLLFISLVQPMFMFMLTRHLNQFDTGAIKNLKV